jgi:microcystin-dependent protein
MGLWSDWYEKNAGKEKALTSAEFVLKKIDEAVGEVILTDSAESNTLPATTKTPITTLLQTIRNNLKWLFNNKASTLEVMKTIYRVGSLYFTTENVNPGTWMPETTWVAWGSGQVPVGVNTGDTDFNIVEKTGGKKKHTLTVAEIPVHSHPVSAHTHPYTNGTGSLTNIRSANTGYPVGSGVFQESMKNGNAGTAIGNNQYLTDNVICFDLSKGGFTIDENTTALTTDNTGSDNSHNNLQPYITCYMWKRTT